jgi:hypothetical protein
VQWRKKGKVAAVLVPGRSENFGVKSCSYPSQRLRLTGMSDRRCGLTDSRNDETFPSNRSLKHSAEGKMAIIDTPGTLAGTPGVLVVVFQFSDHS